eukprot:6465413-Amphidinium_carterae.1
MSAVSSQAKQASMKNKWKHLVPPFVCHNSIRAFSDCPTTVAGKTAAFMTERCDCLNTSLTVGKLLVCDHNTNPAPTLSHPKTTKFLVSASLG